MASETLPNETRRPLGVFEAASVAEASDLVRRAGAEGFGIVPVGGGTMIHQGGPSSRDCWMLDFRRHDGVVDYPARDMTITVQAGITISRLRQILGEENQELPVDVASPDRATVGGALAVNASGPRRLGFGTLRDWLIGVSFLNDAGVEVKAGGRVVKNVAGYDLCKLQIGAFGTLGPITQATFKVKPRSEARAWLSAFGAFDRLADAVDRVVPATATRPTAVCVMNDLAAEACSAPHATNNWTLSVLFEENHDAVEWQSARIREELKAWEFARHDDAAGELLRAGLTEIAAAPASVSFKLNVRPGAVTTVLKKLNEWSPRAALLAHAQSGIVLASVSDPQSDQQILDLVAAVRGIALAGDGNFVITRLPHHLAGKCPIWGEPRGDRPLMKRVKKELDPRDLFNPGRFLV